MSKSVMEQERTQGMLGNLQCRNNNSGGQLLIANSLEMKSISFVISVFHPQSWIYSLSSVSVKIIVPLYFSLLGIFFYRFLKYLLTKSILSLRSERSHQLQDSYVLLYCDDDDQKFYSNLSNVDLLFTQK